MNETTHEIFGTIYKDVNDLSELNLLMTANISCASAKEIKTAFYFVLLSACIKFATEWRT
jgi:hypothetical protein